MKFNKHALKIIAVFIVLFFIGLILKLLGLFDSKSVENFMEIPGYSQSMSDTEFVEFATKYVNGDTVRLKNVPSEIMDLLSESHKKLLENIN
jgi:hypothetical protein